MAWRRPLIKRTDANNLTNWGLCLLYQWKDGSRGREAQRRTSGHWSIREIRHHREVRMCADGQNSFLLPLPSILSTRPRYPKPTISFSLYDTFYIVIIQQENWTFITGQIKCFALCGYQCCQNFHIGVCSSKVTSLFEWQSLYKQKCHSPASIE